MLKALEEAKAAVNEAKLAEDSSKVFGATSPAPMLPSFEDKMGQAAKQRWQDINTPQPVTPMTPQEALDMALGLNTAPVGVLEKLAGEEATHGAQLVDKYKNSPKLTELFSKVKRTSDPNINDLTQSFNSAIAEFNALPPELQAERLKLANINVGEFVGMKDRKSTRLNSSHIPLSRMPSSA